MRFSWQLSRPKDHESNWALWWFLFGRICTERVDINNLLWFNPYRLKYWTQTASDLCSHIFNYWPYIISHPPNFKWYFLPKLATVNRTWNISALTCRVSVPVCIDMNGKGETHPSAARCDCPTCRSHQINHNRKRTINLSYHWFWQHNTPKISMEDWLDGCRRNVKGKDTPSGE